MTETNNPSEQLVKKHINPASNYIRRHSRKLLAGILDLLKRSPTKTFGDDEFQMDMPDVF